MKWWFVLSKYLLGIKKKFLKDDPGWEDYIKWMKLLYLNEIRSIDPYLNKSYLNEGGIGMYLLEKHQIEGALEIIPKDFPTSFYLMFAVPLSKNFLFDLPFEIKLLGCDLSDETHTYSLLNCGLLEGELQPFSKRLNKFGLLNEEDAKEFQKLLLKIWSKNDPHANTNIWVLYEVKL